LQLAEPLCNKRDVAGSAFWQFLDGLTGLLPQDCISVLFGAPKSLKSFVALDWALSVARGEAWLGHKVEACEVVYVIAEGTGGFGRRVEAWLAKRGLTLDDVPRFRPIPGAVAMTKPSDVTALIAALKAAGVRPGLIVIDTVAKCFGGKDTYQHKDMGEFVDGCARLRQEFGATVLVIHHTAKNKQANRAASSLGSVALEAAADAVFMTKRNSSTAKELTLINKFQKDDEEHRDVHLRIEAAQESIVLVPDGLVQQKAEKATDREQEVLRVLAQTPFGQGLSYTEWKRKAGYETNPNAFNAIREKLIAAGHVRHDERLGYLACEPADATGMVVSVLVSGDANIRSIPSS
jgi:RecA-family ATPase